MTTPKKNKRAFITGASSGIGLAFARALAAKGYELSLSSRNLEKLREVVSTLPGEHQCIAADLSLREECDRIAAVIGEGGFDLLINNAGYAKYGIFHDVPLDVHRNVMALNVDALVTLSHAFLSGASEGDVLINVSSVLSRLTYPGAAVYAATKGFVTIFSESLWYENKEKGIYIMALLPGATRTAFHLVATGSEKASFKERAMSYSPEVVVREALRVMERRQRPSYVTGPRFRWLDNLLSRVSSRARLISFMGRQSPVMRSRREDAHNERSR